MGNIKLTFIGDIMLKKEMLECENNITNNTFDYIFEDIKDFLDKSDYVIGNLETPLTTKKNNLTKKDYQFTAPIQYGYSVKNAGIDLVTAANNHCLDNGLLGVEETIRCLNKIGLDYAGIHNEKNEITIKEVNGLTFGFISCTYGTNAFLNKIYLNRKNKYKIDLFQNQELSNPILRYIYFSKIIFFKILRKIFAILHLFQFNKPIYERKEFSLIKKIKLNNQIKKLKKSGAKYIILCIHIGGQYNPYPLKTTKKIIKYYSKRDINLIIGNHEHVIHQCEYVNNKFVTYSLGNFVGTAGVLNKPFDKFSEYSLIINIYFSNKNDEIVVEKRTFTIAKSIKCIKNNRESVKVVLLYDLINNCQNKKEKEKLIHDNNHIISIVMSDIEKNHLNRLKKDIRLEYPI